MHIYREILRSSWSILRYNPWLWVLGFLAAFAGIGSEYSSIGDAITRMGEQADSLSTLQSAIHYNTIATWWNNAVVTIAAEPWMFVVNIVFILFIFMVFIWLMTVGQAGLVVGISAVDDNKKLTVIQATRTGIASFWPIFVMNLLTKFFTYLVIIVAFLPFLVYFLLGTSNDWTFDVIHIISFVLAVPLSIIISFILRYSIIAIVLEGKTWWHALERGINVFLKNWLVSLEMAAILEVVSLVINMVVFWLVAREININTLFAFSNMTFLDFLHTLPTILIFIATGILFVTFQYSCWVLLFKRLDKEAITPKIVRVVDDLPQYMKIWWKKPILATSSKSKRR